MPRDKNKDLDWTDSNGFKNSSIGTARNTLFGDIERSLANSARKDGNKIDSAAHEHNAAVYYGYAKKYEEQSLARRSAEHDERMTEIEEGREERLDNGPCCRIM